MKRRGRKWKRRRIKNTRERRRRKIGRRNKEAKPQGRAVLHFSHVGTLLPIVILISKDI